MTTSAFNGIDFNQHVAILCDEVRALYLADRIPWVVGYSGGKDSTATLQLVWMALAGLPREARHKTVHVISTDTLVENPVVASWVSASLQRMTSAADGAGLPITPHRLTPDPKDSFWVNLIGKGYPAPRPKFRWCTERLKIKPSNRFITDVVRESGEAIVVLGIRKAESSRRAHTMQRLELDRVRERLSPNASLPNSLVYSPLEDWSNDDVWIFLMQVSNPWGIDNKDLLTMYQGASPDGECPLVVDTTTPSCGDSRFGCWVCTLVDKDKSMQAMIQNDDEKEWMRPLLALRNKLDPRHYEGDQERQLRDFRRLNGSVQLFRRNVTPSTAERPSAASSQLVAVPGPYKQGVRENWLREVLAAQQWIRRNGPVNVKELELITLAELQEIRRIWVIDKHEAEDSLPRIYADATGEPYPGQVLNELPLFSDDDISLLRDICGDAELLFEMTRELLDLERQHRAMLRRKGLLKALDAAVCKSYFDDESDAIDQAVRRKAEDDDDENSIVGRFHSEIRSLPGPDEIKPPVLG